MNEKLQKFLENILPFLIIGTAIALITGLFIMLSYVLFWGLLIGAVLWFFSWVKSFFAVKNDNSPTRTTKGRIIEHSDKD
ncbi:hypothetical protein [Legionella fairfieldensis]|uniref:hypothetical protein n=1 Tax=Legionella fairfieldensis TaxID=45064 RepID=UPI00048FDFA6|nr:hypothetical protein [Legionella fairfieldensis]